MFETFVISLPIWLMAALAAWKTIAAFCGLVYRCKWVLVIDALMLLSVAGICVFVHVAWDRFARPGSIGMMMAGFAAYIAYLGICTGIAYLVDLCKRRRTQ